MGTFQEMKSLAGLVFVMDDDEAVRNLVVLMLKRFGLEVESFACGEDLLVRYNAGMPLPDLMLLDIQVGAGMGGEECLQKLHDLGSRIPAIAMTGMAGQGGSCPEACGFSGYLGKPFTITDLHAVVDRQFNRE